MFPPKNPMRGKGWDYLSTNYVFQIGINTWRWRNVFVHGKNVKEKRAKERETTLKRTSDIYSNPPTLLRRFPAITEIPKTTRIRKDTHQLQAWLRLIDQHSIITASEQQRESGRYNPLLSWFNGPIHHDHVT